VNTKQSNISIKASLDFSTYVECAALTAIYPQGPKALNAPEEKDEKWMESEQHEQSYH
jgi:hypothetical protein